MTNIKVLKSGIATFVEDEGRFGYYHIGVPPGGALDKLSFQAANLLVGNDKNDAVLEVAFNGPELEFENETYMAVTGTNMSPIVNGQEMPMNEAFLVPKGANVKFNYMRGGARSYIAIAGGIDVPIVLGSRSTYPLGAIGGFKGRNLAVGDIIQSGAIKNMPKAGKKLDKRFHSMLNEIEYIRVLPGLQDYKIQKDSYEQFFNEVMNVSNESNRMGYRFKNSTQLKYNDLEQPFGAGSNPSNITDACYPVGSIQVPNGEIPIVLLKDAPSGGGYGMIGTVISVDLNLIGQLPPNHKVQFKKVNMKEALEARKTYNDKLKDLYSSFSSCGC